MAGKVEIGYIVAQTVFGETGATIMGVVFALMLISTVSAMTLAGPRVLQVIGQDFHAFRLLAKCNRNDVPAIAIITQAVLTLIFVLSSSFEAILVFAGFTLGVNTVFTVAGVFVLRWREPERPRPYRTWLYPWPPLIYMGLTCWTLYYILSERPEEAWSGLGIIAFGGLFYAVTRRLGVTRSDPSS